MSGQMRTRTLMPVKQCDLSSSARPKLGSLCRVVNEHMLWVLLYTYEPSVLLSSMQEQYYDGQRPCLGFGLQPAEVVGVDAQGDDVGDDQQRERQVEPDAHRQRRLQRHVQPATKFENLRMAFL